MPSFPTLLVNLNAGQPNINLLQVAHGLAEQLGAAVIGVAARQPMQLALSGTCYIPPEVIDEERAETDMEMRAAEAEFRKAFHGSDVEWRESVSFASPCDYIVDQTRHADLLLTGMPLSSELDATYATAGELVMQCGRPVLMVPPAPATPSLDRVLLAWKDTREARRAALDALPLLKQAAYLGVIEIAADEDIPAARERVEDVARWLACHGVVADPVVVVSQGDDSAQIEALAREAGVNLIVAGAYGHNRLREWAFGGFTRTLVQQTTRCVMLSH